MVILFDAVGTLIHPHPSVPEVYARVARQFGSKLSRDDIKQRFQPAFAAHFPRNQVSNLATNEAVERSRWQKVVTQVLDDVDEAAAVFDELWRHFEQADHWRLFDDVPAALEQLATRGHELGIASNLDHRLHTIIGGLPPLQRCRHVFVSTEIGFAKPSPQFYQRVQEQLSVPSNRILMVGDDDFCDVIAPRAFGWQTLKINRDSPEPGAITSLAQVVDHLAYGFDFIA